MNVDSVMHKRIMASLAREIVPPLAAMNAETLARAIHRPRWRVLASYAWRKARLRALGYSPVDARRWRYGGWRDRLRFMFMRGA
jgi:hypothetical protein